MTISKAFNYLICTSIFLLPLQASYTSTKVVKTSHSFQRLSLEKKKNLLRGYYKKSISNWHTISYAFILNIIGSYLDMKEERSYYLTSFPFNDEAKEGKFLYKGCAFSEDGNILFILHEATHRLGDCYILHAIKKEGKGFRKICWYPLSQPGAQDVLFKIYRTKPFFLAGINGKIYRYSKETCKLWCVKHDIELKERKLVSICATDTPNEYFIITVRTIESLTNLFLLNRDFNSEVPKTLWKQYLDAYKLNVYIGRFRWIKSHNNKDKLQKIEKELEMTFKLSEEVKYMYRFEGELAHGIDMLSYQLLQTTYLGNDTFIVNIPLLNYPHIIKYNEKGCLQYTPIEPINVDTIYANSCIDLHKKSIYMLAQFSTIKKVPDKVLISSHHVYTGSNDRLALVRNDEKVPSLKARVSHHLQIFRDCEGEGIFVVSADKIAEYREKVTYKAKDNNKAGYNIRYNLVLCSERAFFKKSRPIIYDVPLCQTFPCPFFVVLDKKKTSKGGKGYGLGLFEFSYRKEKTFFKKVPIGNAENYRVSERAKVMKLQREKGEMLFIADPPYLYFLVCVTTKGLFM